MGAKQLLSANSYVQFPKYLGYYLGINETLLLSVYCDKDNLCALNIPNFDGWFYAKQSEVFTEIGLSEKQQSLAIRHLRELNIISVKKEGNPAITYYKIDETILENVLNVAYNQYLSLKRQSVESRGEELSLLRNDNSHSLHINKNNINKNNKKEHSPEAHASSTESIIKNSRRNFREKVKPLEDILASGKILDEQKKERRKSSTEKMKDRCLDMIEQTSYDSDTKALLIEYFTFISDYSQAEDAESKLKVVKSSKVWCSKLDALAQLVKKGYSANEIILQSLNNKKYAFYPLSSSDRQSHSSHETLENKLVMNNPEESRLVLEKLRADPNRKVY